MQRCAPLVTWMCLYRVSSGMSGSYAMMMCRTVCFVTRNTYSSPLITFPHIPPCCISLIRPPPSFTGHADKGGGSAFEPSGTILPLVQQQQVQQVQQVQQQQQQGERGSRGKGSRRSSGSNPPQAAVNGSASASSGGGGGK